MSDVIDGPPVPEPLPSPEPAALNEVHEAQAAADAAQAKATAAQAAAEARAAQAVAASQRRADEAEAARPRWQSVHAGPMDHTEFLALPGGYLIRSAWRAMLGQGANPMDGAAVVYVPGDAPVIPNPRVMTLTPADLVAGTDPETATLADVHPIRQIPTAPEVLLLLGKDRVRVLKSRDASAVGTVRAPTAADGIVK